MDYSNTFNAHHYYKQSQLGFTLIELMISITIVAIIMGISIPSFAELIARNKVSIQTNAIFESLYLARSYAITQQKKVHVCRKSNSDMIECHQQNDYNATWSNGWLVFVDTNNDNNYDENDN